LKDTKTNQLRSRLLAGGIKLGSGEQVLSDLPLKSKRDPYRIASTFKSKRKTQHFNNSLTETSQEAQDQHSGGKFVYQHPETIVSLGNEPEPLPDSFKRQLITDDSDQITVLPPDGDSLNIVWCVKDLEQRWQSES
jgi:hypothetical protein